jgi:nitrite reductase/ring-hydroxylating ferredoxin subunit
MGLSRRGSVLGESGSENRFQISGARWPDRKRRRALPLARETAGTATLCVGGWMGGTLAYRNQIGVDHRYANAGKWQEARVDRPKADALEAVAHGLEMNQMKLVHVLGNRVAVGRTGKGYVAFQDRCTHKGGPLSDGALMCGTVQCPWHGSQFDVHTGEVKAGPAEAKIETYDVHEQKKKIGA